MHYKILFVFIIAIVGGFFYLHNINPSEVEFVLYKEFRYTVPVTYLVIGGFVIGIVLTIINAVFSDLRRFFKDMKVRKDRKRREASEADYAAGVSAFYSGDYKKARRNFTKVLDYNPIDLDIYMRLSECQVAEGEAQEAIKILEKGLLRIPQSMELMIEAARLSGEAGDYSRTENLLTEILRIDSDNLFALKRIRDYRAYEKDWLGAIDFQRQLVACLKKDDRKGELKGEEERLSGLLYEHAAVLLEAERYEDAAGVVKDILKANERFIPAHMLLGEAYHRRDDVAGATRLWKKGYETTGDPTFFLKIEELYMARSEPDAALEEYKNAVSASPRDVDLSLLLARFYLRLEMVDEAIEELQRIKNDIEDSFYLELLLGEAHLKREQGIISAKSFRDALGLDHDNGMGLMPAFECASCGRAFKGWEPRCPRCRTWASLKMTRARGVSRKAQGERYPEVSAGRSNVARAAGGTS